MKSPLLPCVPPALIVAAVAVAVMAGPTVAAERYLGVVLGSWHVGTGALNNVNPGVTFGRRWPSGPPGVEWHLESGVFYNSYEEVSPIVLGGVSTAVAEVPGGALRAGLSLGTGYYEELSGALEDEFGIPNIGGFIPLAAASLAYRARACRIPPHGPAGRRGRGRHPQPVPRHRVLSRPRIDAP